MKHNCTHLVQDVSVCSVHRLKVDGILVTKSMMSTKNDCLIKSRCSIDGYDWEIQFCTSPCKLRTSPYKLRAGEYCIALVLVYLGAPCDGLVVHLDCRLVETCNLVPIVGSDLRMSDMTRSLTFKHPLDRSHPIHLARGSVIDDLRVQAYINNGSSFTVECTINVRRIGPNSAPPRSSDLHQHLGELLKNQSGVDVTFVVSGESISAHKNILAARSPIFMAEFFGNMLERSSQCVEIQDMHPAVFKAMLHYIYTETVPELQLDNNKQPETTDDQTVIAQHLLVAADRYGLDGLKTICEQRLTLGIGIGTVASILALAEQHNFSQLKAKCIDFISGGSSENLEAVLETEGYRHLEASNPSVLSELLKAAHGKKRKEWMDS